MDYGFSRRQQIEEKLAEDNKKLSVLKESLAAADNLTSTMVSILNQFDERLLKLEETILPVHRKTKDLQRMRDNIDKTIVAFDHVISYHHVPRTVEPVLRRGPSRQVDRYIECMVKLSDAVKFFRENNPDSPELNNVVQLFDNGKEGLKKEFQSLLTRHTRPAQPQQLLQALKDCESLSASDKDSNSPIGKLVSFPVKATSDISKIAKWLLSSGKSPELKKTYAEIRSNNLLKELISVKEYVREKGLQGSSPRKFSTAKDTPKKTNRRGANYHRKASSILRKDSVQSVGAGISKGSGLPTITDEDVVDIELEPFLDIVTCAEKLFEAEFALLTSVIPNGRTVFDSLIQGSLALIEQDGSKFVTYANQCVSRRDHPQVVNIFPAINHLKSKLPGYVAVLKDANEHCRSKIPKLISELDSTSTKVLEDFTDSVKSDPGKESNMPKDGTVHELTSNVMLFLQQLSENQVVVGGVLASQHHGSYQTDSKGEECLSQYMGHVLGALKLNLENKSRYYVDSGLAAIFLLNNYNFILNALNRHGLLELVQKSAHDIRSIYTSVITEQKKKYLKCWDKFAGYLSDDNKQGITIHAEPGSRLKDKEKQIVKEKLKSFNNDLEDLVKVHRMWSVPDAAITEELHNAVKKMIVPPYCAFRDRYRMVQFTKNIEKYLKHTPEGVEEFISKLFDQSSV